MSGKAEIVRRSFLGSIGAVVAELFGAGPASADSADRLEQICRRYRAVRRALPPDPTADLVSDILGVLDRWRGHPGIHCGADFRKAEIEEEPVLDPVTGIRWMCTRRGPQVKVTLTITDVTRLDQLSQAYYRDPGEYFRPWPDRYPVETRRFEVARE